MADRRVVSAASIVTLGFLLSRRRARKRQAGELPFSAFLADLSGGRLDEVLVGPDVLTVTRAIGAGGGGGGGSGGGGGGSYQTRPLPGLDRARLLDELAKAGVRFGAIR